MSSAAAPTPAAAGRGARPTVLVYRRDYLPISETFVVDHLETLRRWRPVVGFDYRIDPGIAARDVPARTILPPQAGRVRRMASYRLGHNSGLARLLRDERAQLIHAHFLTDAALLVRFARQRGVPLVVTAHGYDASVHDAEWQQTRAGRFFLRSRRHLIRDAARIVCVSDFIRGELIARGFPPDRLVTRYLGIDLEVFRADSGAARAGVLFAGRLVEKKGVLPLLDAWKTLPPAVRAEGLTIIGDGPDMPAVREAAAGHDEIRVMGRQPRAVIGEAMRRHRVLAFPSTRARNGDSEGLPIVSMEAQALGLPIVAFNDGPAGEMLARDESGLLVPARDTRAFGEALGRVLTDDGLSRRLGQGGVAFARDRFDLHRNTAALEQVYDQCLAERR